MFSLMLIVAGIPGVSGTASASTTPVPLSSLSTGNTVWFAGYRWIVLNPATGYLFMRDSYGSEQVFDSNGSGTFNPSSSANIGYYLNNTFYNSLPSTDRPLIQSHSWPTGNETNESSSSVDCGIGLISYSEFNTYKSTINYYRNDCWWTRTNSSGGAGLTWSVLPDGSGLISASCRTAGIVHPALYLNPGILVSGGNGGTVIGGTYE
ncbi:MAG: hypothetical protein GX425_16425 [Peptococcaceae bacterium]|nr:hypothetical protein [Peptococcaceae bacterium]